MKIGISALKFNLEDALNICKKNKKISHIEMGIDNLEDVEALKKYKDEINKLNLSISIHLPMELNTCEDIKFIRNSWVDFICEMDKILSLDFDIKYYNAHLGYIMTSRLEKNRQKYLDNTVEFLNEQKLKAGFSAKYHMSISEYTNSIRMTMAENLLSTTELSIDEISKQLGYNYSGNFVKMFKKTHGKTPLAFRKLKI